MNIDEDRLQHSISVARKMVEIANQMKLSTKQQKECFVIGYNHDIGYEISNNPLEHNKIGGEILKKIKFKFWKEIYYYGEIYCNYTSLYLDILNMADMQIDKYGNDVGYDERLQYIKARYGENSEVYLKCYKLVEKVRNI